jgi:hypothetical protein
VHEFQNFVAANWLVIVLAIIGIFVSWFLYKRSLRAKRPSWSVHTADLVTQQTADLPGLTVLFNGALVPNLSVSRVVLFNAGADPIRRADIAPAAPLALGVSAEVTMLAATLVVVNNPVNQVTVEFDPTENRALVAFDYLAKGEGAVFDVIHHGGAQPTALVTGVVIGSENLHHMSIGKPESASGPWAIGTGLVALVGLIYLLIQTFTKGLDASYLIVLVVLVLLPGLFSLSFFQRNVPKGLEAFHERRYRTPSKTKKSAKGSSNP